MSDREKMLPTRTYEVGYRKPPVRTRFRTGQSGNPRGRPAAPPSGHHSKQPIATPHR